MPAPGRPRAGLVAVVAVVAVVADIAVVAIVDVVAVVDAVAGVVVSDYDVVDGCCCC